MNPNAHIKISSSSVLTANPEIQLEWNGDGQNAFKTHYGSYVDNGPSLEVVGSNTFGHNLTHIHDGFQVGVHSTAKSTKVGIEI